MGGGLVEVLLGADQLQHVAELDGESGDRGHLEVGAGDPGDGDIEPVLQIEFPDRLSEDRFLGDQDAAIGRAPRRVQQVGGTGLADDSLEIALSLGKTYGVQLKADDEHNKETFRSLRSLAAYVSAHRA